MYHLFHGKRVDKDNVILLDNGLFGIEVTYSGKKGEGSRYIYTRVDQKSGALSFFAFDTYNQKKQFLEMIKIQGVGGKSGYILAMLPRQELAEKLEKFDIGYFTSFPGIGPKTAKRILVELKIDLEAEDVKKLSIDDSLLKNILTSLHDLGYERKQIKKLLPECPFDLKKKNLPEIMKRLVDSLAVS